MLSLNTYLTDTREIKTFNVRPNHAFFNSIYNLFRPVHRSIADIYNGGLW